MAGEDRRCIIWHITFMKNHIITLSSIAMTLLVAGCATTPRADAPQTVEFPPLRVTTTTPEHILLKTVGSSGQTFSAVLTVDGSRREINGVTPAAFPLECVVLVGEVTAVGGDGSFSFVIERQDGRDLSYTPAVQRHHRFRYHSGGMETLAPR